MIKNEVILLQISRLLVAVPAHDIDIGPTMVDMHDVVYYLHVLAPCRIWIRTTCSSSCFVVWVSLLIVGAASGFFLVHVGSLIIRNSLLVCLICIIVSLICFHINLLVHLLYFLRVTHVSSSITLCLFSLENIINLAVADVLTVVGHSDQVEVASSDWHGTIEIKLLAWYSLHLSSLIRGHIRDVLRPRSKLARSLLFLLLLGEYHVFAQVVFHNIVLDLDSKHLVSLVLAWELEVASGAIVHGVVRLESVGATEVIHRSIQSHLRVIRVRADGMAKVYS